MLRKTIAGLIILIITLLIILGAYLLFCLSHWYTVYLFIVYGDTANDGLLAFVLFLIFGLVFDICWVIGIIGLSLITADSKKIKNRLTSILGLIIWILFLPIFFLIAILIGTTGFIFFIFPDSAILILITVACIITIFWTSIGICLPLYTMDCKRFCFMIVGILSITSIVSFFFSFMELHEKIMFGLVPLELGYIITLILEIIGCFFAIRWTFKKKEALKNGPLAS
jgi:hypothetical protein